MPRAVEEILSEALQLSEVEREQVAESLLMSIDSGGDENVEEAWIAEVDRRCVEIDEGKVQLVPGGEVMSRLRARFIR